MFWNSVHGLHRQLLVLSYCLAIMLLVGRTAAAQSLTLSDNDVGAIRTVITRQLDAFRRDDGATAFSYASPMIRRMFGTADTFMSMVRRDYPPVYRPREFAFHDIVNWRGQPTQRVLLVGPAQEVVIALYQMQQQANGQWLINGCFLVPAGEEAT